MTMPPKRKAPAPKCKLMCCTLNEEAAARVTASLVGWYPGKWAEENDYGPACHCSLRTTKEACTRHERNRVAGAPGGASGTEGESEGGPAA